MFNLSLRLPHFATKYGIDVILCIGAPCGAGLLIHAYSSAPWSTGTIIMTFLLLILLLGQLVLFLVVHMIWRLWQKRRCEETPLTFRVVSGMVIQGYIRALVGELALISVFALFHTSPLTLLQLITFSFTAISIITTLLTSQYWKQRERQPAVFNVLCLGFGIQLFLLLLVKLL